MDLLLPMLLITVGTYTPQGYSLLDVTQTGPMSGTRKSPPYKNAIFKFTFWA